MGLEFLKWIFTVLTAAIAAFLGAYVGLGKYKREKAWDAKNQAYQNILNALNEIRFWANENYSQSLCLPTTNSKTSEELYKSYANAKEQLEKYVYIGELIISTKAKELLETLLQELSSEDFRFEDEGIDESNADREMATHCEKIRKIVETHLPHLVSLARADLK